MEADDPLWQEFAAETAEHLDALEAGLAGDAAGGGAVDVLFRAMHSLKGMSSAIGAHGIGTLAHKAEDVLGLARAGRLTLDPAVRAALLAAVDALRGQRLALLERRQDLPPPATLLARLGALAEGRPEAPAAVAPREDPLRATLASRLADELPRLQGEPGRAPRLAALARDGKLPRLALLLEAIPAARDPLAALGRLRRALMLLPAGEPVPRLKGDLRAQAEATCAALAGPRAALARAAEQLAAAADALGDEQAELLARQIQDLAVRLGEEPAQRLDEARAAFAAALAAPSLAPLTERLRPAPPPLTPGLAAALPPSAHARAAAAMAAGRRIWRLRLGPLPTAEAIAEPFLGRAGEVLGSAGPPEALDLFLASDLPPAELAALRAEADPDGGALTDLTPADAPPPAPTMRVRQDRIDAVIALEAELRAAALALGEAIAAPQARSAFEELAALQAALPPGTAARLASALERLRAATGAAERAHGRLSIALGQLDEAVLELRVMPFASLAMRLPRVLRATAEAQGKLVALEVVGEEVQIDRSLSDLLADPLLHLVRNAVDHGIETAEERIAAGKPATARLLLVAERLPGRLVLSFSDDGRGIDDAAVLSRALARRLISAEAATRLSQAEIHALLFLPGFSTRDAISETSGRGVGLDVVQDAARRAGGAVRVESKPGQGTRFVLDLPLTAAMQPVLLVEAGGQPYALPAGRVEAVMRPEQVSPGQAITTLEAVLHLPAAESSAIVLVRRPAGLLALAVERVGRRTDLLLKPLHPALAGTPGVGGVGVLGNGEPVLLLEPDSLESALPAAQPA
ncbi:ATP-binding protein [Sediminicoccus sp. KRV36]|uniref:ATP-binding protein n=1 Tax=Sediminicoccus sp. KRV36 TaxID=3133721 RepID=UPI00200BB40E|nr:ATP-binding protein [Sediminicoccus rosea]UPY38242.1 Hpt domain-containing protein [Sediminicoccus rosea]